MAPSIGTPYCNCKQTVCICDNISYYPYYKLPPEPKPDYNFGNNYGWICPQCNSVYAPWIYKCDNCPKTYTTSSTNDDEGE